MTTTPASPAAPQPTAVDAALLVLKSMGLTLEDLDAPGQRPDVPTFADYVPVVSGTVTDGTRKAYGSYLREKGETVRWQPVSPTLMGALARHAEERHAPPDGRLLRYADGRPVTYRRYDGLWVRIGRHLPWVRTQQISTHWLRHTTLTWVERNFGYAIAHAYAGHTDGSGDTGGATSTYVRATLAEVATALAALTGEPHPLAEPEGGAA
jgi:integrase